MYSPPFPLMLTLDQNTLTSKPMRQIQILIDFTKNGTDGHQMDQIMGKTKCSAKNKSFVFLSGLMDTLRVIWVRT